MRSHLLVVSEKKIKILKTTYAPPPIELSFIGGATIFFAHNLHTYQIYVYNKGLLSSILWELCSAQTTPVNEHWTQDDGRWTLDAGPSTPYYKLTGELKTGNK